MSADNHDGVFLLYVSRSGLAADLRRIELESEYAAPPEPEGGAAIFVVVRTLIEVESPNRHRLRNFYRLGGQPERPFLDYLYTREPEATR